MKPRLLLVALLCTTNTGCQLLKPRIEYRTVREKVVCEGAAKPAPVAMLPTPFTLTRETPPRYALDEQGVKNLANNIGRLTGFAAQQAALTLFYVECIASHNRPASP